VNLRCVGNGIFNALEIAFSTRWTWGGCGWSVEATVAPAAVRGIAAPEKMTDMCAVPVAEKGIAACGLGSPLRKSQDTAARMVMATGVLGTAA